MDFIYVYNTLTSNLPLPITVLLCTKETNEEEITCFIYRVIECEYPVLFIMMNPDNLELSNAQYFLYILESLYVKKEIEKEKMKSTLLITFNDNNSPLKKELVRLKGHDYFTTSNLAFDNIKNKYNKNPVKVWSSNGTGVGKSTQIIRDAKEKELGYIYFPIGGIISRKDIINRLKHLEIIGDNLTNYEIHIDIYDSNEETSLIIKES